MEKQIETSQEERSFDPALWLDRFKSFGGTVWLDPLSGQLCIGWEIASYTDLQNHAARETYRAVEKRPERIEAVKALLQDQARWKATLAEFEALNWVQEPDETDGTDDDIERAGMLSRRLMEMPAPDRSALRWKLDYILAEENGCASYTAGYLAQTLADYRRFLGDA